jgi:hypothetical protein
MRPLRWKNRYLTGQADSDQRNKAFVDCLNSLINAAGQREHCREIDDFISQLSQEAEEVLSHQPDAGLLQAFRERLIASLPLPSRHSAACRQCGICDLAEQKVAEHLETPAQCLNISKPAQ